MDLGFLSSLEELLRQRKAALPEDSYTGKLFRAGDDKILQKVGEEAVEFIIDAKNHDRGRTVSEGADLLFHFMMALVNQGLSLGDIAEELKKRHRA